MNLLETIEQADGRWFRPVLYRDSGDYFAVEDGYLMCFHKDFSEYYVPSKLSVLTGGWEFVSRKTVIDERGLL